MIRRLLYQAPDKLSENGIILLEMDPEQFPAVEVLVKQLFPEATTSVEQDLTHMDRVFVINRAGEEGY